MSRGDTVAEADGNGLAQRPEEAVGVAVVPERLGVAQVGVRVHETDLAAEEAAALGALEESLRAAAVFHRPVEQPGAVGAEQMLSR